MQKTIIPLKVKACKTCINAKWERLDSGMVVLKCGNDNKNGFEKCDDWIKRDGEY